MAAGGTILQGYNPLEFPFSLFIIQVILIICFSRLIGYFLHFFNQPRVIAEVLGGIFLGMSGFSLIPEFKEAIFPDESLESLNTIAELGLVFFLFLVGLELDLSTMIGNAKQAAIISMSSIFVPFVVSIGASRALYEFVENKDINDGGFGPFCLFTGVAMSITAFPVLARILSEGQLMSTHVGQIAISAAAANDVVAWILLLIVVALVNNTGEYLVALYVFLVTVAFSLILYFVVRPLFRRLVEAGAYKDQISELSLFLTFVLLFVSAWFTQAIGVHAIFGAFMSGLIMPHEHGFAIKITEKIEDLVSIVFLPLYFAVSGLSTRLDQLNTGLIWGMSFLVIGVACFGKIFGSFVACKFSKLSNRESLSVGILMNTKGLIELIVLNIGLDAGVINETTFSIMVVMALFTTFMTTPLIAYVYPKSKHSYEQKKTKSVSSHLAVPKESTDNLKQPTKVLLALKNMQSVRPMMSLMQMASRKSNEDVEVVALRMLPLGDRLTSLMRAQDNTESIKADPVLDIFKTFAHLNHMTIESMLAVSPLHDYADNIVRTAEDNDVNLIVVSYRGTPANTEGSSSQLTQFFDDKYNKAFIVDSICTKAKCSVAVFIDRGFNISADLQVPGNNQSDTVRSFGSFLKVRSAATALSRVFLPFCGGADDREALLFVMQFHKGVDVKIMAIESASAAVSLEIGSQQPSTETLDGHVLEVSANESREDAELLEYVNDEIQDISKNVTRIATEGSMSLEHSTVESGRAYEKMIEWLKEQGATSMDLVVVGRQLFEKGRLPNAGADALTQLENSCPASFCVIQHHTENN